MNNIRAMVSKALGKYVQSLHQKKYRHRHGAFLVEGGKSVLELLIPNVEHNITQIVAPCYPAPALQK
ncbi:hypothetical protein [Hymenobacter negativus]|uniref:hypothetical protein n=1 Tax=Hymenobacter negativus TaxID=2795026 RepID=UPI00397DC8D1